MKGVARPKARLVRGLRLVSTLSGYWKLEDDPKVLFQYLGKARSGHPGSRYSVERWLSPTGEVTSSLDSAVKDYLAKAPSAIRTHATKVTKPRVVCGECFDYAYDFVRKKGGALKHGRVTHPWDGNDFWHAWVEKDGKVHDWQSAEVRKTDPVAVTDFYTWWKPRDVRSYSANEAEGKAAKFRHKGPW